MKKILSLVLVGLFVCSQAFAYSEKVEQIKTSMTAGSIAFVGANSTLTQDNTNLFFDDTNNRIGQGDATPDYFYDLQETWTAAGYMNGFNSELTLNPGSTHTNGADGGWFETIVKSGNAQNYTTNTYDGSTSRFTHSGTGTVSFGYGAINTVLNSSSGTITTARALQNRVFNSGLGTVTNAYGLMIFGASNTGGGTVTNNYGLYISTMTAGGTINTAIKTDEGDIVFNENGNANADVRMESDTKTNAFFLDASADAICFNCTTPIRPLEVGSGGMRLEPQASAPSSPASGDIYVDSTANPDELCFYDGAAWQGISSGTDANCA